MPRCAKSWQTPRRFLKTSSSGVAASWPGIELKSRKIRSDKIAQRREQRAVLGVNEFRGVVAKGGGLRDRGGESKRNSTGVRCLRELVARATSRACCHGGVEAGSGQAGEVTSTRLRAVTTSRSCGLPMEKMSTQVAVEIARSDIRRADGRLDRELEGVHPLPLRRADADGAGAARPRRRCGTRMSVR